MEERVRVVGRSRDQVAFTSPFYPTRLILRPTPTLPYELTSDVRDNSHAYSSLSYLLSLTHMCPTPTHNSTVTDPLSPPSHQTDITLTVTNTHMSPTSD